MGLFSGKKNNEELKKISDECLQTISKYIDSSTDENRLNMMFTKITIFRMKYDKKDSLFQNFVDRKKREQNLERNRLIILQMDDILANILSFNDSEYEELNILMNAILPPQVANEKNGWNSFWRKFFELFDKGSGKK
jgi:septum formation topological specificity factor MinE